MKNKLLTIAFFATTMFANAQTARLQVIHNAADPGAAVVDIYVNGAIFRDDFAFRTATPFQDVPAGVPLSIAVAPGTSTSVADALATIPVTLTANETYLAVARGVLNPANFAANPNGAPTAFNLSLISGVSETASAGQVRLNIGHNSSDAPTVDIIARDVATLVDGVSYPSFATNIDVPANNYFIDITPDANNSTIVATFDAPLATFGGSSLTVLASGFLTPSANQNGSAFGLIAVKANGDVLLLNDTAVARLQIIHNCADPLAASVDIYVNGAITLDNFAFRTATPFLTVPAGVELSIAIAPSTSSSAAEALATIPVTLVNNQKYVAVARGVVGTGFAANPNGISTGFALSLISDATLNSTANNTNLIIGHNATDAPTVDIIARDVTTLVNDVTYPGFSSTTTVPSSNYLVDITLANDNSTIVKTYDVPLSAFQGQSLVVLASGFLTPSANNNGAAFGLIAVKTDGSVILLNDTLVAKLQVIHNCADPAAAVVDVYANNNPLLPDFAFRTATPYVSLPAGVTLNIQIAPGTSGSAADALATIPVILENGKKYVAIAKGVLAPANFAANPNSVSTAFGLFLSDGMRDTSTTVGEVQFRVFHGATDAPTVDVLANGGPLVDNATFNDFTNYISVPAANYNLDVTPGSNNNTIVASFVAPLSGLASETAVVFASGFLTPANNQNGDSFGLFAALADGTVVPFSNTTSIANNNNTVLELFPNPASDKISLVNLPQGGNLVQVLDLAGKIVISKEVYNNIETISLEDVSKGAYFVRVQNRSSSVSTINKVIKN
jgi:hypothetical protein